MKYFYILYSTYYTQISVKIGKGAKNKKNYLNKIKKL